MRKPLPLSQDLALSDYIITNLLDEYYTVLILRLGLGSKDRMMVYITIQLLTRPHKGPKRLILILAYSQQVAIYKLSGLNNVYRA